MDLRVEAADGNDWTELRDLRPASDDDDFRAVLRVAVAGRVHTRPFWFGRSGLAEFLREAEWLARSTAGEAILNHIGRPDYLTLLRDADGWSLAGEVFHFDDPEQHVRFRIALSSSAADALVRDLRRASDMRARASQ